MKGGDHGEEASDAIKVFVASTPAEWLPARVLEFSIRETTTKPVVVRPMYTVKRDYSLPNARENMPRTPFSFQRFLVPEICGFQGRAIYLDADMQVFSNIAELWGQCFNDCDLQTVKDGNSGRRGQFSVLLLDCARLHWNIDQIVADLDSGKFDYESLMYEMRIVEKVGRDISPEWNSLERFQAGNTRLLHYTDMNTQPWISATNPLAYLWINCLRRALAADFITLDDLELEVERGHVRPSLLAQIESDIDDVIALPAAMRKLDRYFFASYRRLRSGSGRPWRTAGAAMLAFLRRRYYQSALARFFR